MKLNELSSRPAISATAEQLLERLASSLDIPNSRYEAAERSYRSVSEWLDRPGSRFKGVQVSIYPQGSFRLGTPIRPFDKEEDYDLDVVCEFNLSKLGISQAKLKEGLGEELTDYAEAHGMETPENGRRCWTLNYADGAQFHMDVLPALPDGTYQRLALENLGYKSEWADLAIAITDEQHRSFKLISDDWMGSNPKGYAEWFRLRMKTLFDSRRQALALEARVSSVEKIPEYRVKTPLQAAIQILKRHRDVRFSEENGDQKPISIIITTLAAHAYQQETTIGTALFGILTRMEDWIEDRNGTTWIANPTDPRENFADKWAIHPERKTAFYDWLEMASADFQVAAEQVDIDQLVETLAPRMGRSLMESVADQMKPRGLLGTVVARSRQAGSALRRILDAPHRKPVLWRELSQGYVRLDKMTVRRNGYRPYTLANDGDPVWKNSSLLFEADTNIPQPFQVYWQVVNTGNEARANNCLRGTFQEGAVSLGKITHQESTSYAGSHSIECFIVKNGYCLGRSGPFIVNIR